VDLTNEQKGRRAKEILDDPIFIGMIDTVRAQIMTQWNLTDFEQTETRESLYCQGRALDEMLRGLRTLVADWTMDQSRNKTKKGRK
jgi:hypothetical protein